MKPPPWWDNPLGWYAIVFAWVFAVLAILTLLDLAGLVDAIQ